MNYWILPSNLDQFDVESCIAEHRFVYWKQKNKYEVGDIVFIYCSGAVGKIRYATIVEEVDLPYDDAMMGFERKYWKTEFEAAEKEMKLRLLQEVNTDAFSRTELVKHGLRGNLQGAITIKGDLLDYVVSNLSKKTREWILEEAKFGDFDSWVILSYNKIVKISDYAWFNNNGSSVPKQTRWFWNADKLNYQDKVESLFFKISYENQEFEFRISTDGASNNVRTRMFWPTELSKLYREKFKYKKEDKNFPQTYILFEKEGNNTYKATFINDYKAMAAQEFNIRKIIDTISASGLIFNPKFVERYVCSLLTKPFVILSGLTGSGKTQLAMAFPKLICKDSSQYKLIPVGADWTNREQLLGYPNALRPGEYVMPDNGALQLILEASKPENQDKPYFLVLDEMNMSYVERYFADFLSAMESGEAIPLWSGSKTSDVPATITLPKNLFIIGTINVDETTYMFSPKVLDRANVIEFRINKEQMLEYLDSTGTITKLGDCSERAADFVAIANKEYAGSLSTEMKTTLIDMFDTLGKIQKEFGYRTAHEMSRYITITKCFTGMSDNESIDSAIVQKLLPKVHGSRKKVTPVLKALWAICYEGEAVEIDTLEALPETSTFKYPLTTEKIWRMFQIAQDNGFTSFAEA